MRIRPGRASCCGRRGPSLGRVTWLCLLVLALSTGCAGGPTGGPTGGSAPTSTASTPTPEGNGSLVPDLPDLSDLPDTATTRPGQLALTHYGADVSWPQCPKGMGIPEKRSEGAPMPTSAASFLIIGLTNGPSFVANPCIADQVGWARERGLWVAAYAVLSYPDAETLARYRARGPYDGRTRLGALRNTGYQAALFNLATLRAAKLPTPVIWVDVEPVVGFEWSPDLVANAAVVQGAARGYADAGFRVGFYSTPSLWKRVVGDLRVGGPEWRAAGQTSAAEARRRCRDDWSFQGGTAVLGQWVEAGRDRDLLCAGTAVANEKWFGRF